MQLKSSNKKLYKPRNQIFLTMEVKILKQEKDRLEIEIDNLTIAELVRKELGYDDKVEIAAWKRDHPTKNPVLIVKMKEGTARKALLDCLAKLQKTNDDILDKFKAAVK